MLFRSPPAFNLSQHQGLSQGVGSSHQVARYWSVSFSISPANEYSELISFRLDWMDLVAVQGTLKRPKYWSFSFSISPSKDYSRLISFRIDWFDLLQSKGLLRISPAPQFKSINSLGLSLLCDPTLTSIEFLLPH